MGRVRGAVASLVAAAALAGCSGYSDLPLPLREQGQLTIESFVASPLGPSRAQVRVSLPDDVAGPLVVVGNPVSEVHGYRVISWALGPCQGENSRGNAPGQPLRLCVAAVTTTAQDAGPLALTTVIESRADARRFTVSGAEEH